MHFAEIRPSWGFSIRSKRRPPQNTDGPWNGERKIWYHGTSFVGALSIMADGFLPTVGSTLHEKMKRHFTGILEKNFPVTYCAKNYNTATFYPYPNTDEGYAAVDGCGLGVVPAVSGGYPVRAVIICEASTDRKLAGQPNQSIFLPYDLHITHVVFYGIDFRYEEPRSMQLRTVQHTELQRYFSVDVGDA